MKRKLVPIVTAVALGGVIGLTWVKFRSGSKPKAEAVKPAFEDEACRKTYENFYRKPALDLKVVFGYKDARPARFVADRYERMIFVQRITKRCRGQDQACGFIRSPADADLFLKKTPGPDGKERVIYLRVIQSSAGPDDVENRTNPYQKWRTRYATLAFLQGLSDADAVFYNGHSRAGGGPDFEPPRLGKNQDVAFDWYKRNEPGFNQIIATLEGAPSQLKLLGLYSCTSTKHFLDRVRAVKPDLGLITSTQLLYYSDALESSLEAVSSLLRMKCEGSFRTALKNRRARASGALVSGFFEDDAAADPRME